MPKSGREGMPICLVMESKSLFTYFKECFTKNYANFKGRARRSEYWGYILFLILLVEVPFSVVIISLAFAAESSDSLGLMGVMMIVTILRYIVALACIVPGLAVAVRRMHDIGRSGWWVLVPIVNLVLACMDSQPEDNEYGPNPKKHIVE